MVVRCTQKLVSLLGRKRVRLVEAAASEDDWYAKLIWLDRRKCLLLAHADTLFPVFVADVRAAELRPFEERVVGWVEGALLEEGLPPDLLGRLDAREVVLAKTASRRVLGVMNEMAFTCAWRADQVGGFANLDVDELNHWLRRRLHSAGGDYREPLELALARLEQRQYKH